MANNIELERNAHCRAKKEKFWKVSTIVYLQYWSAVEKLCLVIERERNPPRTGQGRGSCGNFEQHQQNLAPATPLFAILCVRTRKCVSAGAQDVRSSVAPVHVCKCVFIQHRVGGRVCGHA
jgi:hypothetical protein